MNKKHFVYSFQYLAVLLSLFTFTACEKDQFTAEDALALEEQRARLQHELDEAAKDAEVERMKDLQKWAHTIDSLNAANAGGLVFYSVSVVPGGSTAFANGRYEEVGVNGVTVTASQYGLEQSATTNNGIAVFPEPFRSGEVTVTVDTEAQGFTSAHYTSNLTPDGGVPNDGTVFVNNIIPVFENDPGIHGEEDMAMISGAAWAELNLLYGNNVEELAPQGTAFTAVIDTRPGYGFWEEYIMEANGADEAGNGNVNNGTTKSGSIQMIRYENASTRAQVQADGSYDMMVSATASGLPVRMNYSEFVADRTWFQFGGSANGPGLDDEDFGVVSKRTLYGPDVNPTAIGDKGLFDLAQFSVAEVSLVERNAVIDAAISSTGEVQTISAEGYDWLVVHPNASGDTFFNPMGAETDTQLGLPAAGFDVPNEAYVPFNGSGRNGGVIAGAYVADGNTYLDGGVMPPMVTFSASPSGDPADNVSGFVVLGNVDGSTDATVTNHGGENQLREVVAIAITNKGANYNADNPVTVTIGSPNNTGVTGTGTVQAPSSTLQHVRVIDGGYGFHPSNIDLRDAGSWTGWDPVINVPGTITDYPAQGATEALRGLRFTYDWENDDEWGGAYDVESVGTVQDIDLAGDQGTWDATELATLNNNPFVYFSEAANINLTDADGDFFFGTPVNGALVPNLLWGTGGTDGSGQWVGGSQNQYAFNGTDVPSGTSRGAGYVFVPEVRVIGGSFDSPAQLRVFMDSYGPSAPFTGTGVGNTAPDGAANLDPNNTDYTGPATGGIAIIELISGGSNYQTQPTGIQFVEPVNSLDAAFFTQGSSIDNYAINQVDVTTTNIIEDANWNLDVTNTADIAPTNNTYHVLFESPVSGTTAIGVASFDDTETNHNGVNSGRGEVVGVEIVEPGDGYESGNTYTWELVPTNGAQAYLSAFIAPDNLTFTLVDGGLGYAVQPDVYVVGGGVNLDDANAVNPEDFDFTFDNNGTIIGMSFTDNTNGVYTAANAAIDPIVVTVTVEEQEAWFNNYLIAEAFSFTTASAGFLQFDGDCDAITSLTWIDLFAGAAVGADVFHDQLTAGANAEGVRFKGGNFLNTFITEPTMEIFGFGAGAAAEYVLDPTDGTVKDVVLTNGGTGYGCIGTNDTSVNLNGEEFRVLGGPDGNTVDADGDGMADPFQVYSGLQYVRDVHYGTGEVLE